MRGSLMSLIAALVVVGSARAEGPAPLLSGKVAELLSGGRYSYLLADSGTSKVWVACYQTEAKVGDPVVVRAGNMMDNFHSPTLNRTFDKILFASAIQVGTNPPSAKSLPAGYPPLGGSPHGAMGGHGGMGAPKSAPGELIRGEVLETMEGGGYTYVHLKTDKETVWAAGNRVQVAKGDRVVMSPGMVMQNFESPTLNRKFDKIHFVDSIRVDDGKTPSARPALPPGHP